MKADTYKHKGLRKKLIEHIASKGISDKNVLHAMETLPRHFFIDTSFAEIAYEDKPFPIGHEQTISQPYTVAFQTQLLQIEKGHKVLEIGTGSGYQACILTELGARVYTVERIKDLYLKTKKFLFEYGFKPKIFLGDGYLGLPPFAPFDRILVTAGAPSIPQALIDQLVPGGILVIPVDTEPGVQMMKRLIKNTPNECVIEEHGFFRFVPLLENKT